MEQNNIIIIIIIFFLDKSLQLWNNMLQLSPPFFPGPEFYVLYDGI